MSLQAIQAELKAPKGQRNTFGNYNYRSCEDILEAVKPLLAKYGCTLTLSDEMIEVGGRVYVKATATLTGNYIGSAGEVLAGGMIARVSACAREAVDKKGMDDAQITGAASSYARKYALNGLFCIDDTKDADATNQHGKEAQEAMPFTDYKKEMNSALSVKDVKDIARKYSKMVDGKVWSAKEIEEAGNLYHSMSAKLTSND